MSGALHAMILASPLTGGGKLPCRALTTRQVNGERTFSKFHSALGRPQLGLSPCWKSLVVLSQSRLLLRHYWTITLEITTDRPHVCRADEVMMRWFVQILYLCLFSVETIWRLLSGGAGWGTLLLVQSVELGGGRGGLAALVRADLVYRLDVKSASIQ